MTVYLYGIIAALCATGVETVFKKTNMSWLTLLPYTITFQFLLNYSIFRLIRASENLLTALVVFTAANMLIRITSSIFIIKAPISKGTWIAVALLILAQFAKRL